jgi:hypothetical protein
MPCNETHYKETHMIYPSDSADAAIEKTLNEMCRELMHTPATHEDFAPLVDAIAKLRASLNSPVCQSATE